jgi:hypothetical protein
MLAFWLFLLSMVGCRVGEWTGVDITVDGEGDGSVRQARGGPQETLR